MTESIDIRVRVITGASRNQYVGKDGDWIKFKLSSPPVKGKANKALIRMLSEMLELPRRDLKIIGGEKSNIKIIRISGLTHQEVESKLQKLG